MHCLRFRIRHDSLFRLLQALYSRQGCHATKASANEERGLYDLDMQSQRLQTHEIVISANDVKVVVHKWQRLLRATTLRESFAHAK